MVTVGSGKYTYEVIEDWAKLPFGWTAPMAAVAIDSRDRVYGFNRGNHGVIIFDREGNYAQDWADVTFTFPHAIYADSEDNIWIVDRNDGQIHKFTDEGIRLMTLGEKGHRSDTGADPNELGSQHTQVTHGGDPFNLPAGVAVAPSGDIFVADGYANSRVHRFAPNGAHKLSWGDPGTEPGQFMLPHGIWIDSKGRVLVADRENDRVQVFTQDGELISVWDQKLIGPAVFWVDDDDVVYIAEHNGGLFSIHTSEGELLARWGSEVNRSCHGVAGDSQGNLYFVQPVEGGQGRRIVKYVRQDS